jgi:FAD/FMN-containing dehydrogenase
MTAHAVSESTHKRCVDVLLSELGGEVVSTPEAFGDRRMVDWSGCPSGQARALVRPRTTQEVSTVLQICNRHRVPVIAQGGLTGLAGGASIRDGEIALSLERMRAIEEVDAVSGTITVQAGVLLQTVQEAALAAGYYFPLDLGARGSCMIGGVLATNAGGNRVIKYGMAREHVLDLEAVLADGQVVGGLHKMLKNNTGYDLRNLLIGSEGTLGVITRAVLRLQAKPRAVSTAWCGLSNFAAVTTLLRQAQASLGGGVSAFEVMWPSYYNYVLGNFPQLRRPLSQSFPFNVLLETDGTNAEVQESEFVSFLGEMLEQGIIDDAAIANSDKDALDFWALRDAPGEFPRLMPNLVAFDISFAISRLEEAVQRITTSVAMSHPGSLALFYGHLGDGNIHLIVDPKGGANDTNGAIESLVYEVVGALDGAVSAEHGIGVKKRGVLPLSRGPGDLAVMRAIKNALDPNDILAPDRVITKS